MWPGGGGVLLRTTKQVRYSCQNLGTISKPKHFDYDADDANHLGRPGPYPQNGDDGRSTSAAELSRSRTPYHDDDNTFAK